MSAFLKIFILFLATAVNAQELFMMPAQSQTRWQSFENPTGAKGQGGKENRSAKGHAWDRIRAGESKVLLTVSGSGTIRRMWMTISDRSPAMLRALKLEMFWDGASTPAVSAPFGEFFGVGLGRCTPFETDLFSDPEGRSFNCFIPMPFRTAAQIVVTNESSRDLNNLFYDIDYTVGETHAKEALYFHCAWRRENKTPLGKDFEILPKIAGKGRFLGSSLGVMVDSVYKDTWWGEGEVKIYLDGDGDFPTLTGTGTEDYIGTGWGEGVFNHRYQGCLVADNQKRQWAFYRYHIPDPIYFHQDIRVTLQQMGGGNKDQVADLFKHGVALLPVTADDGVTFTKLLDMPSPPRPDNPDFPGGWVNFYRQDDWSATAYFYLDAPANKLPPLAKVEARTKGL